jgi:hypothetical protein
MNILLRKEVGSYSLYFSVVDFNKGLFKSFFSNLFMIKDAGVLFRQSMSITVNESTFTFNSQ